MLLLLAATDTVNGGRMLQLVMSNRSARLKDGENASLATISVCVSCKRLSDVDGSSLYIPYGVQFHRILQVGGLIPSG